MDQRGLAGGCPLGSLASDLSESDPVARVQLAGAFAQWEGLIRDGLVQMQERGELTADADPVDLAVAMLAAVQGGCCSARCVAIPLRCGSRSTR